MAAFCDIRNGFAEDQRGVVAALYWQAFEQKLGGLLGPTARGTRFLADVLDPTHALTATDGSGNVLGVAGVKTAEGALVGGEWGDLQKTYGVWGTLWRAPLLSMLERPVADEVLLMDGIAVAPEARGQGLGGRLLEAVFDMARDRGLAHVRLDVIDSNPRARALYERKGFVPVGSSDTGPFQPLFGFRTATQMERRV